MFNRLLTVLNCNKVILSSLVITLVVAIFVKVVLVDIVYVNQQFEKNRIITPWGEKIKSGNLSVDYTLEQTLSDIERLGLNTINVPVEIDISSLIANSMSINLESKTKAIQLIKKLRYKGINVILEPFPFIQNGELGETKLKPTDLNEWFWNWKQGVLSQLILEIALPYKVYALCIGSNFDQFENQYGYWTDVADFVRTNYKGKITYRTNWWYTAEWNSNKESKDDTYTVKLNNPLLGKLDFISVAAYFELTDKDTNLVDNLVSAIHGTQILKRNQDIYNELKNLSFKWNKPLFFGELGFPKRNQASVHPWNPSPSNIENDQEQANCFQAYKEVFEKETWNLGFSVFAIGKDDETKNYYPSNLSVEIIKSWY
ncbi:Hydrolase [Candidatus Desulfosporosinus infrequens]|uniref:Hydrolase n=1 Tax=Candidatus Desulfosporosinus infrequens TaxID=2043169 RepID=A0A2U3L5P4_9FIRM|nr:Hydrolase [Candidatus Desulfosporosinus infrequens]